MTQYCAPDSELLRLRDEEAGEEPEDEAAEVDVIEVRLDVEELDQTANHTRIAEETHVEPTRRESTRDRGTTLVRTVPSLSVLAQHARLNCLAPSGPAFPKECGGLPLRLFSCVASEPALSDTACKFTRQASRHASARTVCATGVAAGEVFFGVAWGVPALVSLPPTPFLATRGREGNASTPQPQSRDKDAVLLRLFLSPKDHTATPSVQGGLWAYSGYVHP